MRSQLVLMVIACCVCSLAWGQEASTPVNLQSDYMTMRDGVRIAVDSWVPVQAKHAKFPAIVMFTRYWRARETGSNEPELDVNFSRGGMFAAAGYALVMVDVRGTGASFGERRTEFAPEEIMDYGEIVRWVANQTWSNGRVAATGSSYLGNTAELAAIHGGPAFRSAAPRFSDFDLYRYAVFPGGVPNTVLLNAWASMVAGLDKNDACVFLPAPCEPNTAGVKPVTGAEDLLPAAIAAHANNLDVSSLLQNLEYIDDSASRDGDTEVTLSSVSPSMQMTALDQAAVPMQFWVSWYDAATAQGALSRYMSAKTPSQLIIGPWNHGATIDANPYTPFDKDVVAPSTAEQYQRIFDFFDPLMTGDGDAAVTSRIDYFTVGANQWRSSTEWPPVGVEMLSLYAAAGQTLQLESPGGNAAGVAGYRVDFSESTGTYNRWTTQLGEPVNYADWSSDGRLSFTSPPLSATLEITGNPVIEVWLSSSTPDGALFAYLEDIDEQGAATYITEGMFRLIHRAIPTDDPGSRMFGPFHSFRRADAQPMPEGVPQLIAFDLLPISVELKRGHRIRLSLGGADASAFARIPAVGEAPEYGIHFGGATATRIQLPVMSPLAFEVRASSQ
jgi:putative CocE/NonD family hydrolase